MEELTIWIAESNIISITNYFFAGLLGSLAGRLKIEGESDEVILKRLIIHTLSDGIMGGFAGMFMSCFFNDNLFLFSFSGIFGAMGFKKSLDIIYNLVKKTIKYTEEESKKNEK